MPNRAFLMSGLVLEAEDPFWVISVGDVAVPRKDLAAVRRARWWCAAIGLCYLCCISAEM
jgi:hypothetical protein